MGVTFGAEIVVDRWEQQGDAVYEEVLIFSSFT
jgi:hypothetical protein